MKQGIVGKTADAFTDGKRYIVNEGGTRSGKTFAVLRLLYLIAQTRKVLISIVSETFPHLRKGAVRDFKQILQEMGVWDERKWFESKHQYQLANGSLIEFFSVDSPDKVHGPSREILFINEAQNISFDIARHLFVRTTGQIFIDFNPTHEFWAHTELKPDKDCAWVHSTYKDNPFLTANQVKEIERGKKNQNWWQVYGLGQIGQLEGLVFPAFSFCDTLPDADRVAYGLDFGFSNDPTALIRIATRGDDLYLDEVIYQTELTNREIVQLLKQHGLKPHYDEIIADSAEPKSIHEIRQAGFNVKPAVKGPDSIRAGIDRMLSFNIHITKQSTNLIKEFRNYTWVKDKEGKATGKPVDMYNHGIDAVRYAIQTKTAKNFVL